LLPTPTRGKQQDFYFYRSIEYACLTYLDIFRICSDIFKEGNFAVTFILFELRHETSTMTPANGYGAVSYNSTQDIIDHGAQSNEDAPLLSRKPDTQPLFRRFHKHMTADVNPVWSDLLLLICYTITGLLDSSAVFIWGSFVSMQTGNTVYLGLGLVSPTSGTRWIKSGTSIGFFCLGSFTFARFHRYFSPRRRWVLFTSFGAQMLLIIAAAIIVTLDKNKGSDIQWDVLVPLALVAFQSSGQAVTSRALQFNALTSVVLTSIYCDLFSDAGLFVAQNVERNRRVAAPLCLLAGTIMGGAWAHSEVGLAGALWTAVVLKLVVVFAWLGWKAKEDEE
jgi:uncharacterized membrane protein YoaK (UPF0700 family)